jgi:hypothetical protein
MSNSAVVDQNPFGLRIGWQPEAASVCAPPEMIFHQLKSHSDDRRLSGGSLPVSWCSPHSIPFGAGPSEGLEAPPPAVNLDAMAGRALLAMPQRLTPAQGALAKAVFVAIA